MTQTVKLKVKNGKVDAHEGPINTDGGHFNARPGEKVKWQGNYKDGNFVVTFKDVSNGLTPGWPFKGPEPAGLELIVEGDGSPKPEFTLKDSEALWKYDVAVTGDGTVKPLDPMIIVRDSGASGNVFVIAAFSFLLGALVAMLFRGLGRSRRD
jgi:hypothetical protein